MTARASSPEAGGAVEQIMDGWSGTGNRRTVATRLVVEALVGLETGRPGLTAEELILSAQAANPRINPATIYRRLARLDAEGVVEHVHLGHGAAIYHLTRQPHVHLVCDRCGKNSSVGSSYYATVQNELQAAAGFRSSPHHFAVTGLCAQCAKTGG